MKDSTLSVLDGRKIFLNGQFMKGTLFKYLLRYYDGELVRTIDDPEQVTRGAGFFIMSQGSFVLPKTDQLIKLAKIPNFGLNSETSLSKGLFGGGWFVEGAIEDYEAEFGLPVEHKVDYIRYWKEKN